jgi:hypothetical protein
MQQVYAKRWQIFIKRKEIPEGTSFGVPHFDVFVECWRLAVLVTQGGMWNVECGVWNMIMIHYLPQHRDRDQSRALVNTVTNPRVLGLLHNWQLLNRDSYGGNTKCLDT